ncbi:unnamed protein product [Orchesella dallaii]|uniref:Guanylate cyclase n=1 Tax=Orchesella dallaii TaxID=48710 RepID=A0ABP1Q9X9_9HEXA
MENPHMNLYSRVIPRNRTSRNSSFESPWAFPQSSEFRWHVQFFLVLALMCHSSNSDFNVIIPEICAGGTATPINVTWIRDMVHLGLRDEQLALTVLGPEEICDGSNGLIKFISLAKEDPKGQIIASLEPHLCPTAATFLYNQRRQFFSWTCTKAPGVISIKPSISDVILAVNSFANYYHWHKFAFTKYQSDKSPFCDEIATQLQVDATGHLNNYSVLILAKYEDISLPQYSPLIEKVQGLFLCTSYEYGYTHNVAKKTDHLGNKFGGSISGEKALHGDIPLVFLPEWPLPLEAYSPEAPTLALTARLRPFNVPVDLSGSEEFHFYHHGTEPSSHKIMESLLARLILKSVKEALELEKFNDDDAVFLRKDNSVNELTKEFHVDTTESPKTFDDTATKDDFENSQSFAFQQPYMTSFQFTVLQYEKGRWHQVVSFADMDEEPRRHTGDGKRYPVHDISARNSGDKSRESILTWTQLIGAIILTAIIVAIIIGAFLYARDRHNNPVYIPSSSSSKNISGRNRNLGPYKLILSSHDICFSSNSIWTENSMKSLTPSKSEDTVVGSTIPGSKHPNEKPDLIKGSFGHGPLKKYLSVSNVKNDSIILNENQARYKGDLVHLRKLAEPSDSFQLKAKAMTVLETIHGLRHENINALIGCLTDGIPALVWEYCSRGSLHDIIKQQDIKLDWAFKLSLLTDLVRGMRYLHSSLVRVHGFLTSYNCVIDARWVLKITDYGILSLYHTQGLTFPQRSSKELLWTAPELLRDESLRRHGTQAGDVYSFAIIMQEVLVRGEPYCMLTLSPEEIIEKVKHPPPMIRPSVSKNLAQPEAINIMRQCWAELADMRPDFTVIHDLFKTLNHGRKANIVDTMFQMLEKYSNNLEELIRERTEQLDLEKKKTEQLLNRMLPSMVAEKLKLGLPVDPEEFSEVTIYFSDIVGFTTISAYSTPFEVVDLLNDLYTCFDATINDYNVYKVETIGDAYMCVGGAPVRSPDHAAQIATMALDLLYQSGKFRIRHLPYTALRVRIGLHTGPCCAGVVGLTMPRYCLFGDTVNTASRMESTGAPWRIHISEDTRVKLESIGGFKIEFRGITDLKGKGKMPTYWLSGKEGFDKELPVPPDPT